LSARFVLSSGRGNRCASDSRCFRPRSAQDRGRSLCGRPPNTISIRGRWLSSRRRSCGDGQLLWRRRHPRTQGDKAGHRNEYHTGRWSDQSPAPSHPTTTVSTHTTAWSSNDIDRSRTHQGAVGLSNIVTIAPLCPLHAEQTPSSSAEKHLSALTTPICLQASRFAIAIFRRSSSPLRSI
jgi:hypothetical protein